MAIVPGPNARSGWEQVDAGLKQLAESIAERGVLEPLLIREIRKDESGERRFELLAGFRRFSAAKYLNLARVPARVVSSSDAEARATNLTENLARADIADVDAMRMLEQLNETYGWGVRQIARTIGRPASWVSDLLSIARSQRERAAVEEGRIAVATATRLVRLRTAAPEVRDDLLHRIKAGERVTVDDVPRVQAGRQASQPAMDPPQTQESAPPASVSGAERSPARDEHAASQPDRREVSPRGPAEPARPAAPAAQWREYLEVTAGEQSLYRNMYLSVRQVLAVVDKLWENQGRHRRLPPDLRRQLEFTRDAIHEFLAQEDA